MARLDELALQKTAGQSPALAERMRARLHELLPVAAGILVPRSISDPLQEWDLFGYSSQEVNEFAFTALSRRLKAIGVPLIADEVPA
jgi:ribonucleoside-diphosphate reductase beta chain